MPRNVIVGSVVVVVVKAKNLRCLETCKVQHSEYNFHNSDYQSHRRHTWRAGLRPKRRIVLYDALAQPEIGYLDLPCWRSLLDQEILFFGQWAHGMELHSARSYLRFQVPVRIAEAVHV